MSLCEQVTELKSFWFLIWKMGMITVPPPGDIVVSELTAHINYSGWLLSVTRVFEWGS